MFAVEYFKHRRQCNLKQAQRDKRIEDLPLEYTGRPSESEITDILTRPLHELIGDVQAGKILPSAVLKAFSKTAIMAHERTNCLTEVMIRQAIKEIDIGRINGLPSSTNDKGKPLAGVPVSVKDTVVACGYDTTVGFSSKVGNPAPQDGPMVKLLKDAGAIPFVKTNIPTTLLSFESSNDVWGRTLNPHNPDYTPGGSTGGEAALLTLNGSRVGIGSDVAGSVRLPAAWSGCSALRCSTGRWPRNGTVSSMPGQEGVASVFSPMARSVADLHIFVRGVMAMRPWEYDYSVHPMPWDDLKVARASREQKLRIGVLRTDDVVDPTPACARALEETVRKLRADGHELFDLKLPTDSASTREGLALAGALLNSDGGETFGKTLRFGETNDPGAARILSWARLPTFFRWVYCVWVRYVRRDPLWADVLYQLRARSSEQLWQLVAKRERYRSDWHAWWDQQADGRDKTSPAKRMDVILTVPNATPALPHGAMHDAFSACGYTFLWNMLDYTSGVVPVSKVDGTLDVLTEQPTTAEDGSLRPRTNNAIAKGAYKYYDAAKMAGLPVGVQVIGRRWEEESVMGVMKRIERLVKYEGIRIWEVVDREEREKEKARKQVEREARVKDGLNVRFEKDGRGTSSRTTTTHHTDATTKGGGPSSSASSFSSSTTVLTHPLGSSTGASEKGHHGSGEDKKEKEKEKGSLPSGKSHKSSRAGKENKENKDKDRRKK